MLPRYPIYIPSRGRYLPAVALTVRTLQRDAVPFRLVVEPSEVDAYRTWITPRDELLTLPENDFTVLRARNWIRDHAEASGAERHWQLDDNILTFMRSWEGHRIPAHAGVSLRVCEDLTDRFTNVGLSGLNYSFFVHPAGGGGRTPFYRNIRVYSCVTPETPVLCADLTWRSAGSLRVGQEIVAFDAEPVADSGRTTRCYRTAKIERNDESVSGSCYRVTTDIGDPITASEDHPWLVWRSPLRKRRWQDRPRGEASSHRARLCWVETSDLQIGDQLAHLVRPWARDESHDGGWISGMFDGGGSLDIHAEVGRTKGVGIGIAQKEGAVLTRLRSVLTDRGYSVWSGTGQNGRNGTGNAHVRGGLPEMLRFAGEFRPTRIIARASVMWEGRKLWRGGTYRLATITDVKPVGKRRVASITTSTGTFVTGGYLTHNCSLINHAMPYRWRLKYNEDTDICLQALTGGWATLLVNAFLAKKLGTMTVGGGNTAALYRGDEDDAAAYDTHGRYEMARTLERAWPGTVKITRRFRRFQHVVDWDGFKDVPLGLRHDLALENLPAIDEYGLSLQATKEVRSDRILQLRESYAETLMGMPLLDPLWRGLPAYRMPPRPLKLVVRCRTEADREELRERSGAMVHRKAAGQDWACWWPPRERMDPASLKFVPEVGSTPEPLAQFEAFGPVT